MMRLSLVLTVLAALTASGDAAVLSNANIIGMTPPGFTPYK